MARAAGTAFRRYGAELHRYLRRRLAKPQDAEDLSQEVFLRLLRIADTELIHNPQAYLYGIASNVVREYHMRANREQQRLSFDLESLEELEDVSGAALPDDFAEQLHVQRTLERAMSRLSPTHRAVLLLLKRDGMSYEEAARASGLSVHTVEKYFFQAKAQLKLMYRDR